MSTATNSHVQGYKHLCPGLQTARSRATNSYVQGYPQVWYLGIRGGFPLIVVTIGVTATNSPSVQLCILGIRLRRYQSHGGVLAVFPPDGLLQRWVCRSCQDEGVLLVGVLLGNRGVRPAVGQSLNIFVAVSVSSLLWPESGSSLPWPESGSSLPCPESGSSLPWRAYSRHQWYSGYDGGIGLESGFVWVRVRLG